MCPQFAYFENLPWRSHSPVPFATCYDKPYSTPFEVASFFSHHFCEKRKEWVSSQITKSVLSILILEPNPKNTTHQTWNNTLGMTWGVPRSLFPDFPDLFHSPVPRGIDFITPRLLEVLAKIPWGPPKGNFLDFPPFLYQKFQRVPLFFPRVSSLVWTWRQNTFLI